MNKTIFILIFISSIIFSQNAEYLNSIGSFQQASSFSINPGGFLYITDYASDEIYKLDTLGNLIQTAGGFGWSNGSFDDPSSIYATSLSVYVADKNNNRIQRFDKDLNFISLLYTKESNNNSSFGYPVGCAVSNQGDLYVLDSENNRVVAFDMFGTFSQKFGGFEDGEFSINSPLSITTSSDRRVFVLDTESLLIFDQFGNGLIRFNNERNLTRINITFNYFVLVNNKEVFYSDLRKSDSEKKIILVGNEAEDIADALIFNQKLYVLTTETIHIYNLEFNN